jgi:EAL domain-containing protein (putative c-di-GMP-specific phosphodiesterase class I)
VVGAEALLRWRHPTRGLLPATDVVRLAEDSGLIVPLGLRTLALGLDAALTPWMRERGWVAVNVSGHQLGRGQLPAAVRAALDERRLEPDRLHVEITETALAHASDEAIREVHEIAEMGVSIALDDFGTGYSSLAYLKYFPLAALKIDRSFVRDVGTDPDAVPIVEAIIALARKLKLDIVAEGVEHESQRRFLIHGGCSSLQGFLLGRPLPIDDFENLYSAAGIGHA